MKTIFRFEVPVDDMWHNIDCPDGEIKAIGTNGPGIVEFWCEAQEGPEYPPRRFRIYGTGHRVPDAAKYVGTAPRHSSGLVWHLYEMPVVV